MLRIGYQAGALDGIHGTLDEAIGDPLHGGSWRRVWTCSHNHRTVGPAEDCARTESARRGKERRERNAMTVEYDEAGMDWHTDSNGAPCACIEEEHDTAPRITYAEARRLDERKG